MCRKHPCPPSPMSKAQTRRYLFLEMRAVNAFRFGKVEKIEPGIV